VILHVLLPVAIVVLRVAVGGQPQHGDGQAFRTRHDLWITREAADQNDSIDHVVLPSSLSAKPPPCPPPQGEGFLCALPQRGRGSCSPPPRGGVRDIASDHLPLTRGVGGDRPECLRCA